jgi:hypothetical protein
MNQSASRPRLTRGAHDPKAFAYNIVGLFSQILPLLAYVGRTLNDTMCDHAEPDICDRCQRKLYTLGTLISGSAKIAANWTPGRTAELNARLAVAAVRRLVDVVELGHPVAWAMKGGAVLTAARRAINAAAAVLQDPDLNSQTEADAAARQCQEMDLSTSRVARKHGLVQESFIIGHLLKASAKAAEAAAAATATAWAQAGEVRQLELAQTAENFAGAAIGAALDAAALLDTDPGRAESMMVVATGVCAEFDRVERAAGGYGAQDACEKSTSQKVTPRVSAEEVVATPPAEVWGGKYLDKAIGDALAEAEPAALPAWLETPTEEHNVMNEFEESGLADVADEAIGDAASLAADLERAETILNAIVQEHRAVEQVVRTAREDGADAGMVTQYYQECCVVCRDAKGRPMPSPCRTMLIVQSFGEPF